MNKQIDNKAIEEMAKVICQECITATEEKECLNNVKDCLAYDYAKIFYNAGYIKKVNDDEVVISKEEYAKLKSKCDGKVCYTADEMVEQTNDLFKQLEQTRKETAREILRELSKMRTYGTKGDFLYKIDKLAEKYGVEVE